MKEAAEKAGASGEHHLLDGRELHRDDPGDDAGGQFDSAHRRRRHGESGTPPATPAIGVGPATATSSLTTAVILRMRSPPPFTPRPLTTA